ncbi:hypothetical protein ACFLSE_01620 [Bacteroidota bacterium]
MIKKLFGILAVTALLVSCGNKEQKKEENSEKEVVVVTVDEVVADMQSFVNKEVVIEGIVNHVCSHGGKRMFIMGEDPDMSIKITPSEEIGIFEKELEGSHVLVTGIVKELRIDEAYVVELEKEIAEGADNEAIHDHSDGEHADEEAEAEAEKEKTAQIEAMKTKIAESEEGSYSQFWIEASKFEVKECDHDHEVMEGEEHDQEHGDVEGEEHDHEHEEGEEHSH